MAAPDITATLTGLVDTVGNQVIDATVDVLPVVAPFAIALAVLGAVAGRLGLRKKLTAKV